MRTTLTAAMAGVAAAGLAAGALTACGGTASGAAGTVGAASRRSMELIVGTRSDDFYVSMECGAQREARKLGVSLTITGPAGFGAPEQKQLIDEAGLTRPDALLVAPATDTPALDPDLRRVQQAGTKLIFVDTAPADPALGLTRISSDNAAGGRLAADSLGRLLAGRGTVAVISVARGVPATDARVRGFRQEMAARWPRIRLLPEQHDNADSVTTAAALIGADITAHPHLRGAFAASVIAAGGVASGIARARRSGRVKLATFGADPQQMAMMRSGTIQLAIAQEPGAEGADAVRAGLAALAGRPVPKHIATPLVAITRRNMDSASVRPYVYVSSCG